MPLAELKANPKNARTHSHKQIKKIRRSLRTFGPLNPIVADENNMILAGHGRAEAARQEGFTHLPVLRFSHLTDAQKRAYLIADNKIGQEAGWDREMLALELGELIEFLPTHGLDVALTGFEAAEIDLLIADFGDASQPADTLPPLPEHPTTRSGDLWQLGKHRLLCGDARQLCNFERLMAGVRAAAVFFLTHPITLRSKQSAGAGIFTTPNLLLRPVRCRARIFGNFCVKRSAMACRCQLPAPCITCAWIGAISVISSLSAASSTTSCSILSCGTRPTPVRVHFIAHNMN